MCVIVYYICQKCKEETGQRDYVRHTDGQRFAIPDPESLKVKFDASKYQKQEDKILAVLDDTEYKVTLEGNGYMDVWQMLKRKGIEKASMWKLPGAKLRKWNLYTEDKLKEMIANGNSYNNIKTALKTITGLSYTNYQIITKAASLNLHRALFPPDPAKPSKSKQGAAK